MDNREECLEMENTFVCLDCGIQYSITVDEVLHHPQLECEKCGCKLMLLEDQKKQRIC